MTYTSHGHHILGTVMSGPPPGPVVRCGGPAICNKCSREASRKLHPSGGYITIHEGPFSEDAALTFNDVPVTFENKTVGRVVNAHVGGGNLFVEFVLDPHEDLRKLFPNQLAGISLDLGSQVSVIEDDLPMKNARVDPEAARRLRLVKDNPSWGVA